MDSRVNDDQGGADAAPVLSTNPVDQRDSTGIDQPKAAHRWRRWLAEVGVVVIGVLLALGAQQVVETLRWSQKVRVLERALAAELGNDLGLATELRVLHPCVVEYLDTLQAAVLSGDADRIRKLSDLGAPLFGRAWPRDTWTAALNAEVANHISEATVTAYSRAFLRIGVQREFMQQMEDLYPVALSGAFGLPQDVGVTNGQLVAIQRLRGLEARRILIANSLLEEDGPALSVAPSTRYLAEDLAYALACETNLKQIRGSSEEALIHMPR